MIDNIFGILITEYFFFENDLLSYTEWITLVTLIEALNFVLLYFSICLA